MILKVTATNTALLQLGLYIVTFNARCIQLFDTTNYMKLLFTSFFVLITSLCFLQTKANTFEIFFGNDFDNDSTTLILNGITVVKNYKLKPTMISPKSLIITQNAKTLSIVPYYSKKYTLPRLKIANSILSIKISINNIWKEFKFDLRKGKFLFVELPIRNDGKSDFNQLFIRQSLNGPIYF